MLKSLRHGFILNRVEQHAQLILLHAPCGDFASILNVGLQVGFDFEPAPGRQLSVHIGMQISVGYGLSRVHITPHLLTTLSLVAGSLRFSISTRKRSRPRDRRDMTVPIGTPKVWATSA